MVGTLGIYIAGDVRCAKCILITRNDHTDRSSPTHTHAHIDDAMHLCAILCASLSLSLSLFPYDEQSVSSAAVAEKFSSMNNNPTMNGPTNDRHRSAASGSVGGSGTSAPI